MNFLCGFTIPKTIVFNIHGVIKMIVNDFLTILNSLFITNTNQPQSQIQFSVLVAENIPSRKWVFLVIWADNDDPTRPYDKIHKILNLENVICHEISPSPNVKQFEPRKKILHDIITWRNVRNCASRKFIFQIYFLITPIEECKILQSDSLF